MRWIYSLAIQLYGFGIRIVSNFNPKAKEWIDGRKNWQNQLKELPKSTSIIWFHCASLGEFDQALPLMWELKKKHDNAFILVTFFSPSGMNHFHKRNHCVDKAVYLPLDTPKNAKHFVHLIQPKLAVFVKYEFWANFIFELKKQKIQLISIATILRPNQIFFKTYGSFFRNVLYAFDFFYVQNQETANLLESLGKINVKNVGDTRFDNVIANKLRLEKIDKTASDVILQTFLAGQKALIFGSSWEPEEKILKESLTFLSHEKIIIAPHNVNKSNCQRLQAFFGTDAIRFTQFEQFTNQQILILDTIGHLSSTYQYGKVAVVGGGFSGQLHNILEPAVFGLPVFFGPKHAKFPEAAIFINEGFAFHIDAATEFKERLDFISKNEKELSKKASDFIEKQKGAAERIANDLELF
jgi:3-deoxy-D-manno-octulosonic-acid transferase